MSDKNNLEIGSKMIEFVNANNLKNVKMRFDHFIIPQVAMDVLRLYSILLEKDLE